MIIHTITVHFSVISVYDHNNRCTPITFNYFALKQPYLISFPSQFNLSGLPIMDHAGIKAIDLARKTGISEATISQYRSGYSKPKDQRLVLIANALNVDPAWLMGLNVSMASAPKADPILSDRDAALLEKYHALISAGKDKLDERAEELIRMDYTVGADAKKGGSVSA